MGPKIVSLLVVTVSLAFSLIYPSTPRTLHTQRSSETSSRCSVSLLAAVDPNEAALAFTDYMVKASDEKVRAVRAAEDKAKAEIIALKRQLDDAREEAAKEAAASVTPPGGLIGEVQKQLDKKRADAKEGGGRDELKELRQKVEDYENVSVSSLVSN